MQTVIQPKILDFPNGGVNAPIDEIIKYLKEAKEHGATHLYFGEKMDEHYFVGIELYPVEKQRYTIIRTDKTADNSRNATFFEYISRMTTGAVKTEKGIQFYASKMQLKQLDEAIGYTKWTMEYLES